MFLFGLAAGNNTNALMLRNKFGASIAEKRN